MFFLFLNCLFNFLEKRLFRFGSWGILFQVWQGWWSEAELPREAQDCAWHQESKESHQRRIRQAWRWRLIHVICSTKKYFRYITDHKYNYYHSNRDDQNDDEADELRHMVRDDFDFIVSRIDRMEMSVANIISKVNLSLICLICFLQDVYITVMFWF